MGKKSMLIGIDEAGRGPLAGPVVAAVVGWISPPSVLDELKDSKKLTEKKRFYLCDVLCRESVWSVGSASAQEIDALNIRRATLLAMKRAFEAFHGPVTQGIVDGRDLPDVEASLEAMIKADSLIPQVSAASIIAKCMRDHIMETAHHTFPMFGWTQHKGYPTAAHQEHIRRYGLSPLHRTTFCRGLR